MDQVLSGLCFSWWYIDDMITFRKTPLEHVKHLQAIFEQLLWKGLYLQHDKCKVFYDRQAYLGHMIILPNLWVQ